jgi:hypothetical protein
MILIRSATLSHPGAGMMLSTSTHATFANSMRVQYQDIFIILSPPRCSSTTLARIFWECSAVNFYCHEPFDIVYHRHAVEEDALRTIEAPLDLKPLKKKASSSNNGLLIKEMTFQVGDRFERIASLATRPLIFLIRDPRLSIYSRSQRLKKAGLSPYFPLVETGWSCLEYDINQCIEHTIPYAIVRSVDLRNQPDACVHSLFERVGMKYTSHVLKWRSLEEVVLGNISDQQQNWYRRVLSSTSVEQEDAISPEIEDFAEDPYFSEHIAACLQVYDRLQHDEHMLRPT